MTKNNSIMTWDEVSKNDHASITASFQCPCGQFLYFPLKTKPNKLECSCGRTYLFSWNDSNKVAIKEK
jgi:hypothetical protein